MIELLKKTRADLQKRFDQASLEQSRYQKLADAKRDEMLRLDGAATEIDQLLKDLQHENQTTNQE